MLLKKKDTDLPTEAEKIMLSYAEGNITVYDFWKEFCNNDCLQNLIYNDKKLPVKNKPFLYENIDLKFLYHRCEVFRVVKCYLLRRNIKVNFYNVDEILYSELIKIVPDYINIDDNWFVNNILNKCSFKVGTIQRKEWISDKIKEHYKYAVIPPKWLQSSEWPIGEKGPLYFEKQSNNPNTNMDNFIDYYFYDGNKEIIIRQYD